MLKQVSDQQLLYRRENEVLYIEPYGPNILRVRVVIDSNVPKEDWTLLPPEPCKCSISVTPEVGKIVNGKIRAEITNTGHISFYNQNNRVLVKEQWTLERDQEARIYRGKGGHYFYAEVQFCPNRNEHFYGMGQEAHDVFDLKGSVIDLCQQNTKSTIPFVISSMGYGFLWNNPGIGRVEFSNCRTRWVAEQTKHIDYLVIAGDNVGEIERSYASISGYAPKFPYWATGMWQSKLRYLTQEELLSVAKEYHSRNIPISMIVCDYFHWPQQGEWKFDPQYWPDPQQMVQQLQEMGMRLLVSIWPTVDPRSENFQAMKEQNMLIRTQRGPGVMTFCRGPETYYDATNPDARDFVWDKVKQNYYAYGIKNFWLDEAEPEFLPYDYDNLRYYLGAGPEVSNIYPYYYAKNFYDGMKAQGEEEVLNLIRCAFIGSQRYGVVLWSGDIAADFDSMRRQLKAGLNVSLCGIPWWTTDIGGFHGGDALDPEYRECIIRWFQFGAFCPVFRMHGDRYNPNRKKASCYTMDPQCTSGGPNEIWSYGEEAYEIMKSYIDLREKLRPYIQQQFDLASQDGTPIIRPLLYDFSDEECYEIFDQYMFGPDLMPCPVHEYGCRERRIYLPSHVTWVDTKTGKEYDGGQWICAEATLDWMPLFVRKGSPLLEIFCNH